MLLDSLYQVEDLVLGSNRVTDAITDVDADLFLKDVAIVQLQSQTDDSLFQGQKPWDRRCWATRLEMTCDALITDVLPSNDWIRKVKGSALNVGIIVIKSRVKR